MSIDADIVIALIFFNDKIQSTHVTYNVSVPLLIVFGKDWDVDTTKVIRRGWLSPPIIKGVEGECP